MKVSVYVLIAALSTVALSLPPRTGFCIIEGVYVKPGNWVPAPLGTCAKKFCSDPERNLHGLTGCGSFAIAPGCRRQDEDLTKQYPECCAIAIC